MGMDFVRQKLIYDIYMELLDLDDGDKAGMLTVRCGDDPALKREVLGMLGASEDVARYLHHDEEDIYLRKDLDPRVVIRVVGETTGILGKSP